MSAPNTADPIVIVGAGLAGGNAAATLREEGFTGRVVLIGREPEVPFGRPPLSKTYLRSEEELSAWYVKPPGWYQEHEVECLASANVVAIDPSAHSVLLDSAALRGLRDPRRMVMVWETNPEMMAFLAEHMLVALEN